MCKVPGAENIADILTKHAGGSLLDKHAANMASSSRQAGLKVAYFFERSQCNFEPHAVASWQWSFAQPWLPLRWRSVKLSLLSAIWFSLHSFLVSCTWTTDGVCVSEAVFQQEQVVVSQVCIRYDYTVWVTADPTTMNASHMTDKGNAKQVYSGDPHQEVVFSV